MRTTGKIMILAVAIFMFSCAKNETVYQKIPGLQVKLNVIELVCYPSDSISLTFSMEVSKGIPPYVYRWMEPAGFTGAGPFTIRVASDVSLAVEVADADGWRKQYRYRILKDTIDSLKYDYRNPWVGSYDCEVVYRYVIPDSSGVFNGYDTTYRDTLAVAKHSAFNMLSIPNMPDVTYYPAFSGFMGYHTTVRFSNDSIDLYFYMTPVGLFNYTYKGRRMN